MALFRFILAFLIVGSARSAWANERFLSYCQGLPDGKEKEWMEKVFETEDCGVMARKISGLRSFSEVIYPGTIPLPSAFERWQGYEIPSPPPGAINVSAPQWSQRLEPFRDFQNLTHLNLSSRKERICDVVKFLPQLKYLTLYPEKFFSEGVNDCLREAGIKGIILGGTVEPGSYEITSTITPVIAVEQWSGSLEPLGNFPHLKYLHFYSANSQFAGVESLGSNLYLTHLSIDYGNFKGIDKIRFLRELRVLEIRKFQKEDGRTGTPLTDISFVEDLRWLKTLNLSGNRISDLTPLGGLTRLQNLDLGMNAITNLSGISGLTSLRNLNVSYNAIQDLSPLRTLKALIGLNISGNAPGSPETLPPLPELRSLSAEGDVTAYLPALWERNHHKTPLEESLMYYFRPSFEGDLSCRKNPTLMNLDFLSVVPKLVHLNLSHQGISDVKPLRELRHLQYVNLQGNELKLLPTEDLGHIGLVNASENPLKVTPTANNVVTTEEESLTFTCRNKGTIPFPVRNPPF